MAQGSQRQRFSLYWLEQVQLLLKAMHLYEVNRGFVPCVSNGGNNNSAARYGWTASNTGSTDYNMAWFLPYPSTIGELNLYTGDVRVNVYDADSNDYIDYVRTIRSVGNNINQGDIYNTNIVGAVSGLELGFPDRQIGGNYTLVWVEMKMVCTSDKQLDVPNPEIEIYYE